MQIELVIHLHDGYCRGSVGASWAGWQRLHRDPIQTALRLQRENTDCAITKSDDQEFESLSTLRNLSQIEASNFLLEDFLALIF